MTTTVIIVERQAYKIAIFKILIGILAAIQVFWLQYRILYIEKVDKCTYKIQEYDEFIGSTE